MFVDRYRVVNCEYRWHFFHSNPQTRFAHNQKMRYGENSAIGDLISKHFIQTSVDFNVTCFPVFSILKAANMLTVDYFSLDVERAELRVLKNIPFDRVFIKVFQPTQFNPSIYLTINELDQSLPASLRLVSACLRGRINQPQILLPLLRGWKKDGVGY